MSTITFKKRKSVYLPYIRIKIFYLKMFYCISFKLTLGFINIIILMLILHHSCTNFQESSCNRKKYNNQLTFNANKRSGK